MRDGSRIHPCPKTPATVPTHRPGAAAAPPGSAGTAPGRRCHPCLPPPARTPGAGCGIHQPPPHQVCTFPFPRGVRGPPSPALTLATAAEATSSAAQSRGLSLAISARGRGYGDCPKPSPFSPKPHHCPLPAPTLQDAQKSPPLRSSLAGFPFSRRFLLLEVTNTFSSSAREMYCPTCAHFGGEETPDMGCRG